MNGSIEDRSVHRLGGINPLFHEAALNLALALSIDLEREATKTSQLFKAGVRSRYREAIFARLSRYGLTDLTAIALCVKVDKSVMSRWNRGEASPDSDTLLFAGTAAKVDWGDALPSGGATVTAGICEAVSGIRTQILRREPLPCDVTILALMRYVLFGKLWLRAELTQDAALINKAVNDAQSYVSQRLGREFNATRDEIHRMIAEWRDAYLLFHFLIPFDWPM